MQCSLTYSMSSTNRLNPASCCCCCCPLTPSPSSAMAFSTAMTRAPPWSCSALDTAMHVDLPYRVESTGDAATVCMEVAFAHPDACMCASVHVLGGSEVVSPMQRRDFV